MKMGCAGICRNGLSSGYILNCLSLYDNGLSLITLNVAHGCRYKEFDMNDDDILKENKTVHDLTDEVVDNGHANDQDVIVVDGRGYENAAHLSEEVYNLTDVVDDDQKISDKVYGDVVKRLETIVEKTARDMIPDIAERIIREEIEKLKEHGD